MPKEPSSTKAKAKDTQLTPSTNYDVNRIIFSEPQSNKIPNSAIEYRRIGISTLNKDGSVGDLIIPTERVFSLGVRENRDFNNPEKTNGYNMPLFLWNKDGATDMEKRWIETFGHIVDHCKDYILEHKEELELYELSETDFKKFNPLAWQKEKGKIVDGTGPSLWVKLISFKAKNKVKKSKQDEDDDAKDDIKTMFFDATGRKLDPYDLLGKQCHVKGAVKFESIFLGSNKISLQVKLYEAEVELADGGMKPLMSRPKPIERLTVATGHTLNETKTKDDEDSPKAGQKSGSVSNSDDEKEDEPKVKAPVKTETKVAKPVQRKVIKAKVKV